MELFGTLSVAVWIVLVGFAIFLILISFCVLKKKKGKSEKVVKSPIDS